jgi:hypothetical protein
MRGRDKEGEDNASVVRAVIFSITTVRDTWRVKEAGDAISAIPGGNNRVSLIINNPPFDALPLVPNPVLHMSLGKK